MVTVRTFISYVGKTDLPNGQIHLRSPEVNSSRVLFYLQAKNSGKVILLISAPKVFKHIWIFWSVNSRGQDAQECSRSKRRFGFFYLAVISYANSTCKVKTGKEVDDSFPKNFFHRVSYVRFCHQDRRRRFSSFPSYRFGVYVAVKEKSIVLETYPSPRR